LTIDQRLSTALADRYRIVRELGQGGMATVYLAEDLKHDRKVAIKVLRPELAAVIGAERFLAEIKTTANLQHPHILPLHDSGLADGFLFYVMPFVEGESLRQRLAREGELPVGDTLRIMSEVADALAYAHRHGVVHRDIKPDNVLLAGRHALVADFGIAKAVSRATSTERLTETGMSIGTPLYMSPEQAAADPQVDHRADIYSLGVLGYEMLTGAPPFQGLSAQQVLAAKVTQEPAAVAVRRPAVPPRLNEIIARCLARRPADRYQNAEELLAELEGIVTPGGGTASTVTTSIQRKRQRALALLAGVVGAGLILAAGWKWVRRPFNLTTSNAVPVTTEPGVEFQPALSPDGSLIAYVAQRNGRDLVAVRSTRIATSGEVRPAEGDPGDQLFPSWSPDGEFLRFVEGKMSQFKYLSDFAWRQVGRLGGPTQPVILPRTTEWTAWSRDGKQVAIAAHDSLFIYGVRDTTVRAVGNNVDLNSVTWSPDGQWIAYVTGNSAWRFRPNTAGSTIWMMPVSGQEPIEIAGGDFLNVSPVWLDPRHLLWVSNKDGSREVYAVEVSGKGVRGTPQKVPGGTDAHTISVSDDGKRLAVAKFTARQNVLSFPLHHSQLLFLRDGRLITSGTQIVETHALSPDGQWLVYSSNLRGKADLYKVRLVGGEPIPITTAPEDEFSPAWSPDGSEVAYEIAGDLWVVSSQGGQPLQVTSGAAIDLQPAWSPDGLSLTFTSNRAEGTGWDRWRVWKVRRDRVGARWSEPSEVPHFGCIFPQWVSDNRGFWCSSGDTDLVLISPSGARLERRDLGAAGFIGTHPRLSRDESTFYVQISEGERRGLWAWPVRGGKPRLIIDFSNSPLIPQNHPGALSVGTDALYLTTLDQESDIWAMDLHRTSP